jgi:hypothetical protein
MLESEICPDCLARGDFEMLTPEQDVMLWRCSRCEGKGVVKTTSLTPEDMLELEAWYQELEYRERRWGIGK